MNEQDRVTACWGVARYLSGWMRFLPPTCLLRILGSVAEGGDTSAIVQRMFAYYESPRTPVAELLRKSAYLDYIDHEDREAPYTEEDRRCYRRARRKTMHVVHALGLPPPKTLADLFALLVKLNILREHEGTYQIEFLLRAPEEVLRLSPKQLQELRELRRAPGAASFARDHARAYIRVQGRGFRVPVWLEDALRDPH
jgi:hypothetical protein